jgi:hypothetical protein
MSYIYDILFIEYTSQSAISSYPLSYESPSVRGGPPLSEATTKNNPPCGEVETAQLMRQEIYDVFDGASNQEHLHCNTSHFE